MHYTMGAVIAGVMCVAMDTAGTSIDTPPLITSVPPTEAVRGQLYVHDLDAVDADNDTLV